MIKRIPKELSDRFFIFVTVDYDWDDDRILISASFALPDVDEEKIPKSTAREYGEEVLFELGKELLIGRDGKPMFLESGLTNGALATLFTHEDWWNPSRTEGISDCLERIVILKVRVGNQIGERRLREEKIKWYEP